MSYLTGFHSQQDLFMPGKGLKLEMFCGKMKSVTKTSVTILHYWHHHGKFVGAMQEVLSVTCNKMTLAIWFLLVSSY